MIYPSKYPPENKNNAEKLIYEKLCDLPQESYDVFFQKTFSGMGVKESEEYEIDFLIIDKRNGRFNAILIIEVKDGPISFSAEENAWFQYRKKMLPSPDGQAIKNKHNFLNRFRNLLKNVPIGWILWFPGGYSTAGNFTPTNFNPWQLLDYSHLGQAANCIENAFTAIKKRFPDREGEPIETYTQKLQKSLLRSVGIVQPLNILLKKYDERFLYLEQEQKGFFESLYKVKRLAVTGGAGSGKTMLAASAALDFSNEGKKVQVLCFNKMLSLALAENLKGPNLNVSTFHTFAFQIIKKFDNDWYDQQKEKGSYFHEHAFPAKLEEVIKKHPVDEKFDVLIIDEAQDFNNNWLNVLFMFTNHDSKIVLFYDENQNIFERNFNIPEKESFITIELPYNYRNTKKICDYVRENTGFEIMPRNTPEGIEVERRHCDGLNDLEKNLIQILLKLIRIEKLTTKEIVIIINGVVDDHPLGTMNDIIGIPLRAWDVNIEREENILYYTSISRFKGLESNVVIIITDDDEKELKLNKKFYAQCTRAKSLLYILYCK